MSVITTSDFAVFWEIGRAVLSGLNPYSVGGSWYPPAASILLALTAILPLSVGYFAMLGINALAALAIIKRYGKGWLAYAPLLFVLLAGQVDLILAATIPWLNEKGWKPVAAAIVLSLKPITAVVILPWFMVRWAMRDRGILLRVLSIGGAVHIAPLIYRPTILKEWVDTILRSGTDHYAGGVGIWLANPWIPTWVLFLVAVLISSIALGSNENISRALLMMASPFAMPYHTVMLIGTAPAEWVAPISIVTTALLAATIFQPIIALIPLSIILYHAARNIWLTIPARTGSIRLYGGDNANNYQRN